MRHYFELLWEMTAKEMQARYKNTLFGFLWIFVNPLLQMLVIGFVFKFFVKEPIENYYYFLFVGLLIWNFFSLSMGKTSSSIVNERSLIKKAKFPHSIIVVSIILSNFINLLLAFGLLSVPLVVSHLMTWSAASLFILAMGMLVVFTSGLSLLTAALDVKYRDVNFFVQALLIVWFYATPVVYSMEVIPQNLVWLWKLNPLTSIVQMAQSFLISARIPPLEVILSNLLVVGITCVLGVLTFRTEGKNFDDWL